MINLIGHSLGRYHILEQLGEGGMATVYKAYDTRLETDVAVKVIRTENLAPSILARALKRFEREAKSLAKLTHANIVTVLDYGEYEGKPYLVMPYLPGGTLKAKLNGRPIPWQDAARLLLPIARALGYAHEQGMVHRDVKPANILITHSGDPMLTDFGIAKIIDEEATQDLTGTSAAVGTPEYMAPEQVTAKSVDHRADIYALGVVFYEMVTGRKPFQADTPMAVLFKHASEPLPRPTQFAPELPDAVEKILLKTLAKKAENRYASMGDLAIAMETVLNGTSVPNVSHPKPEKAMPTPPIPAEEPGAIVDQFNTVQKHFGSAAKRFLGPLWIGCIFIGLLAVTILLWMVNNPPSVAPVLTVIPNLTLTPPPVKTMLAEFGNVTPTLIATKTLSGEETPTLKATVPTLEPGELLLTEDFETGDVDGFKGDGGKWSIFADDSGNYVLNGDATKASWSYNRFYPAFFDGIILYRMKFVDFNDSGGDGTGNAFLIFRENWPGGLYNFVINGYNKSANFHYQGDGPWIGLGEEKVSYRYDFQKNIWYSIRLEIKGNIMKAYVDDNLVLSVKDERLNGGALSFGIGPQTVVQFDDVRIFSLPSE